MRTEVPAKSMVVREYEETEERPGHITISFATETGASVVVTLDKGTFEASISKRVERALEERLDGLTKKWADCLQRAQDLQKEQGKIVTSFWREVRAELGIPRPGSAEEADTDVSIASVAP